MAIADIQNGNGIGILDPHGDLAETILDYIPQERQQDVVYLNFTDIQNIIHYNPLYKVVNDRKHIVTSCIVNTFKKIWSESWGPRLEHILRNAIQSLTYYPSATLLDIHTILTDPYFRNNVCTYITDSHVLNFWDKEFNNLAPQVKNEHIAPIVNKIGLLSTHPIIRKLLGSFKSAIDIPTILNNKTIFIANLSKGVLGEEGTQLIGSLLLTSFQGAALERTNIPIHKRNPFYLYIDEMHSFMTKSFADILSESRKYGLFLFITHQYLDQLEDDILKAVLGNVGTLICFRVGSMDAEILEQEFYRIFTRDDLINLPQYHIYLKLLIDGTQSQPFSAITNKLRLRKV
jgi:hypothetical protein